MNCTREDFALVKDALQSAIAYGRQNDPNGIGHPDSCPNYRRVIDACGRVSNAQDPALLQALGGFALLCLVHSDLATLRAHVEIQKIMNL